MSYPRITLIFFYNNITVVDWRAVISQQKDQALKSEVSACSNDEHVIENAHPHGASASMETFTAGSPAPVLSPYHGSVDCLERLMSFLLSNLLAFLVLFFLSNLYMHIF